jgi:hypothetical protein
MIVRKNSERSLKTQITNKTSNGKSPEKPTRPAVPTSKSAPKILQTKMNKLDKSKSDVLDDGKVNEKQSVEALSVFISMQSKRFAEVFKVFSS